MRNTNKKEVLNREWLKQFEGFEHLDDEQLDQGLDFIEMLCSWFYEINVTQLNQSDYEDSS